VSNLHSLGSSLKAFLSKSGICGQAWTSQEGVILGNTQRRHWPLEQARRSTCGLHDRNLGCVLTHLEGITGVCQTPSRPGYGTAFPL
jgi:hypothetical protein